MTARRPSGRVGRYIGAVRAALADLPADEREDLLPEVEAPVADAAGDSDAPVAARLGPPEGFADKLREAAGFQIASTAQRAEREGLRSLAGRAARHPAWRRILSLARDLAPIWWVARGYAAVGILAVGLRDRLGGAPAVSSRASTGAPRSESRWSLSASRRRSRSASSCGAVGSGRVLPSSPNLALVVALWAVLVEVDDATWGSPQAVGFSSERPTDRLALDGAPSPTSTHTTRTGSSSTTSSSTTRPGRRSRWPAIKTSTLTDGSCWPRTARRS